MNFKYRDLIKLILFVGVISQIVACKQGIVSTGQVDKDFNIIKSEITREYKKNTGSATVEMYQQLQKLESIKRSYFNALNTSPQFKGNLQSLSFDSSQSTLDNDKILQFEKWIKDNSASLRTWHEASEKQAFELRNLIMEISKTSYEVEGLQKKLREQLILSYALVYYKLGTQAKVNAFLPLMLILSNEQLRSSEEISKFKKELLEINFAQTGLSAILNQDIKKSLTAISELRGQIHLKSALKIPFIHTFKTLIQQQEKILKPMKQLSAQMLPQDLALMQKFKEDVKLKFNNKTLLYLPGENNSIVVDLFAWISNLTWGSINSAIGLGIVITTMVVSPFTEYVDFPTFKFSDNRKQILVDVRGMSPVPGEMSMGIWELTSAGDFASAHEGGHAIQSALLGPLYLPAVLLSYAISGFDQGFIEEWATEWGSLPS